jgi:hypothetical protein
MKLLPPPICAAKAVVKKSGAPYCTALKVPVVDQLCGVTVVFESFAPTSDSPPGFWTRLPDGIVLDFACNGPAARSAPTVAAAIANTAKLDRYPFNGARALIS